MTHVFEAILEITSKYGPIESACPDNSIWGAENTHDYFVSWNINFTPQFSIKVIYSISSSSIKIIF